MSTTPKPISETAHLPRVLLLPSAGMGHLVPFVRLAASLSSRSVAVSLLAARPTVSAAESSLLSSLPASMLIDFPLAPFDPSLFPPSSDPFFIRREELRLSAHLLPQFLLPSSSSSHVSAVIIDIFSTSTFLPVVASAKIPCFVLFTSSAAMLALCAFLPSRFQSPANLDFSGAQSPAKLDISGVFKIPVLSLPPPLRDPTHLFTKQLFDNGRALTGADGIIINTFDALEREVLTALNSGKVVPGLPPVFDVGPLPPARKLQSFPSPAMQWLDEQPESTVMFVSFGSRTAMSRAQIRELGAGLEISGCRFLWVVKGTIVDSEEKGEIEELVGEGYEKSVEGRGLVVREWVNQEMILGHRAVAGFLSHCGWNSVMEAVAAGLRVLAWPRMGDQKINAAVVARKGLGVWPEDWGWEADEKVVAAEEIGRMVRKLLVDEKVAAAAAKAAAEAAAAVMVEVGSSDDSMTHLIKKIYSNF